MIANFVRHMRKNRRSRVPYLSRRIAVDDRMLMTTDAGFRYVVLSARVRDKAQADRMLQRYGLSNYRTLAVFLHEQRLRPYRPDYTRRLRRLVQRWLGMEQVDPQQREWETYLRNRRPATGHFRQVRMPKK